MSGSLNSEESDSSIDDHKDYLVAEYESLRKEIFIRMGIRNNILNITILTLGAVITLNKVIPDDNLALLIYPIICAFLATGWTQNDLRIGEIGHYIKEKIERKSMHFGWESYVDEELKEKNKGMRIFRRQEIHAMGVFVVTQLLAIFLSVPELSAPVNSKIVMNFRVIILYTIDVLAVMYTIFIIQERRKQFNN